MAEIVNIFSSPRVICDCIDTKDEIDRCMFRLEALQFFLVHGLDREGEAVATGAGEMVRDVIFSLGRIKKSLSHKETR